MQQKNGDAKSKTSQQIYGYTIGGPVIIPKVYDGRNKLFFFYAHEFRPQTIAINNGNAIRLRVPSALERAGDFSQSRDNNGDLLPPLMDFTTGAPFPEPTDPGRPAVCPRPGGAQPLPAPEPGASAGDELQLPGRSGARTAN